MDRHKQDALYEEARTSCGPTIRRLVLGYEIDPERRRDLLQEIHIELWRSLASFDRRCGLHTWVYRIAHNVGATHVLRSRRSPRLVELEALDNEPAGADPEAVAHTQWSTARVLELIHQLKPLDRQIMMFYLEGAAARQIADVTGLSASNVATKIHRIKKLLGERYQEGAAYAGRQSFNSA